jgi:hypothetical protein
MIREEVMEQAKALGWVVRDCKDPSYISIRAYKSETNERMRIGSSGEVYTRDDDGWMWQAGTIESLEQAIKERGQA